MNFAYIVGCHHLIRGALNFRESATTNPVGVGQHDMRLALIGTLTTAGPAQTNNGGTLAMNILAVSSFTTLDEYSGTNYTPGFLGGSRVQLASQTTSHDTGGTSRAEFDATDVTFTSLGADANGCKGLMIMFQPTTAVSDADNIPILWIDSVSSGTSFPFNGSGGNVTITWNAEGIMQVGNGTIVANTSLT